ncbi:MAG: cytochrome C oxidase subunit III [Ectobacillus sp.]
MNHRPQYNPHALNQWQYQIMQQQAMQQGYTRKKGCNCGAARRKRLAQQNGQGEQK